MTTITHPPLPSLYAAEADIPAIRAVASKPGQRPSRNDIARAQALISDDAEDGQEDIYWMHRRDAVRLTHAWQKLFRRCASQRFFYSKLIKMLLGCYDPVNIMFILEIDTFLGWNN